jgi:hypothetical protein
LQYVDELLNISKRWKTKLLLSKHDEIGIDRILSFKKRNKIYAYATNEKYSPIIINSLYCNNCFNEMNEQLRNCKIESIKTIFENCFIRDIKIAIGIDTIIIYNLHKGEYFEPNYEDMFLGKEKPHRDNHYITLHFMDNVIYGFMIDYNYYDSNFPFYYKNNS